MADEGNNVVRKIDTAAAGELLSLPLHPRISTEDVARVAEAVRAFEKGLTEA